ncbi:unnamed protein product [Paramecium sonneborni]|uniref:Uncharacterized protein n=1 Tax=Paramecium sonneborni TaxID=65129 RepID=A0A8S1R5U3_9CILI|nr:unnamed protein product [Paramecium sonneborni]
MKTQIKCKKVFLKLLEKKVSDLDQQISEQKKTTLQSFEYLTQIFTITSHLNSMVIGNTMAIDQIMEYSSSDQRQLILDSYIMRYGIFGIKRRDQFKQAVKNIFKKLFKGQLWFATYELEQKHKQLQQTVTYLQMIMNLIIMWKYQMKRQSQKLPFLSTKQNLH